MQPASFPPERGQRWVCRRRFMESPLSFFACIGTMNRSRRRVRGPGLQSVGPVPSPGGSWEAQMRGDGEDKTDFPFGAGRHLHYQ
jgi:hypothetical protein